MPETDTPLKLLVSEFAPDFAAWLLDVDEADVRHVQPLNIELPAGVVRSDTVFRVTLAGGQVTLLHVEFQGRRSERPMPLRMLDYLSRLAQQESGYLCSTVLYVGDGAGADDKGAHRVDCPDGKVTLAWRYRVIRLWQLRAEELLLLDRPALLALIGQTHIEEPERVVPQVGYHPAGARRGTAYPSVHGPDEPDARRGGAENGRTTVGNDRTRPTARHSTSAAYPRGGTS